MSNPVHFATKNLHDIQIQLEDYVQFESDSIKTFNLIKQQMILLLSLKWIEHLNMYILCPFPKLLIYSKLRLFHSYIPVQFGTRRLSVCMPSRLFIKKKGEKSFMFLIWKMNLFPFIKFPRQRQILFGGSINKKKIKFNFTKQNTFQFLIILF